MDIIATSDLHGFLPEIPNSDLMIIAGDITPPWLTIEEEKEWILGPFQKWLETNAARKTILVAGNKDRVLERERAVADNLPLLSRRRRALF